MGKLWLFLLTILCTSAPPSLAQSQRKGLIDSLSSFPDRFLSSLQRKASSLEERIIRKTEKTLNRLERYERKIYRQVKRKDSLAAEQFLAESKSKYDELRQGINANGKLIVPKQYIPYFDTLKTSLSFLASQRDKLSKAIPLDKLGAARDKLSELDQKLQYTNQVREFIRTRRRDLQAQFNQLGIVRELKAYNKELYYYSEQIKAYKDILQDPAKLERKAVSFIQKLPFFQKFMQEHSELAALFPLPDNYGSPLALQGLQTRASVQGMIQQQMQAAGPNVTAVMQQNIQNAQGQLRQWREKINQLGGMSSDQEIPDFKPNTQKTKTFWQRLEYGTNLQNTRANSFLPVTSDLGLSVGFKINDKSVVGVGASYMMGWGKDIRQITISHEGVGLRSYLDWKLKGSFYLSGGYEQNYRKRFDNVQQLRDPQQWTNSALAGISKKVSISKKLKGDIKILFDFLYRSHNPVSQPILFRFGYNF